MPWKPALLIAEDDPELLDALAREFLDCGFCVTAVRHPRQALAAAANRTFQVAIIAYSLPEQNGVDLMRMLQRRTAGIQVILLSGGTEPGCEREALENGALAFLRKPCRMPQIHEAIDKALGVHAEIRRSDGSPRLLQEPTENPSEGQHEPSDTRAWAEWY